MNGMSIAEFSNRLLPFLLDDDYKPDDEEEEKQADGSLKLTTFMSNLRVSHRKSMQFVPLKELLLSKEGSRESVCQQLSIFSRDVPCNIGGKC